MNNDATQLIKILYYCCVIITTKYYVIILYMNVKIKFCDNERDYDTLSNETSDGTKLAILDSKEADMRNMIERAQREMDDNFIKVREKQKQNKFLTGVVEDYIKYYKYITKQKVEQEDALRIISEYIDSISQDTEITKGLLEQSKDDQKHILAKMKQIKQEVDKITNLVG